MSWQRLFDLREITWYFRGYVGAFASPFNSLLISLLKYNPKCTIYVVTFLTLIVRKACHDMMRTLQWFSAFVSCYFLYIALSVFSVTIKRLNIKNRLLKHILYKVYNID